MPSRREEIRLVVAASEALQNEHIQRALLKIEEHYQKEWTNSKPEEVEIREHAYKMLLVVGEFRQVLTNVVETRKLASTTRNGRLAH